MGRSKSRRVANINWGGGEGQVTKSYKHTLHGEKYVTQSCKHKLGGGEGQVTKSYKHILHGEKYVTQSCKHKLGGGTTTSHKELRHVLGGGGGGGGGDKSQRATNIYCMGRNTSRRDANIYWGGHAGLLAKLQLLHIHTCPDKGFPLAMLSRKLLSAN